jgi:hypothetical protein
MEWTNEMTKARGVVRDAIVFATLLLIFGQSSAFAQSEDEKAAKGLVESFLIAVGDGNLDALPEMFVSDANIGTASLRDGSWVTSTMTFDAWLALLRKETSWTRFREPVSEFTIHVEDSKMAFVRADATVFIDDQASSHNIDYFTLVREDGDWKFLSASYVAKPVARK